MICGDLFLSVRVNSVVMSRLATAEASAAQVSQLPVIMEGLSVPLSCLPQASLCLVVWEVLGRSPMAAWKELIMASSFLIIYFQCLIGDLKHFSRTLL